MERRFIRFFAALLVLAIAAPVMADDLFIYPKEGQSKDKQEQDEFACYKWAKEQTGYDPSNPGASAPPTNAPAKESEGPGVIGGAAGGAIGGAVVGAIAGDAGKGAAIGAAGGGLMGGMKKRGAKNRNAKADRDANKQRDTAASKKRSEYDRARGACLEARGYTVK
jgi:hypothetical protein